MSSMDWSDYYSKQAGRTPRATFLAALEAREHREPGRAIDLGCGDGVETRALLDGGWSVLATDGDPGVVERVTSPLDEQQLARLEVRRAEFAEIAAVPVGSSTGPSGGADDPWLPPADLIYAGFALPFCDPVSFPRLWAAIRVSLRPGGVFAGEFFGPDDEWNGRPGMTFHARTEVEAMLAGLRVVQLVEDNRDGRSVHGPKHWHVFHAVAVADDETATAARPA
jgi:SAM-dependent methyltransferase